MIKYREITNIFSSQTLYPYIKKPISKALIPYNTDNIDIGVISRFFDISPSPLYQADICSVWRNQLITFSSQTDYGKIRMCRFVDV